MKEDKDNLDYNEGNLETQKNKQNIDNDDKEVKDSENLNQENKDKGQQEEKDLNEEKLKKQEEIYEILKKGLEYKNKLNENKSNNKKSRAMIKISFKGLLMVVFIISLIFYIPTIYKDTKTKEVNEITYTAFTENIENNLIKQIEEKEGYVYGYDQVVDTKAANFSKNKKIEPKVYKARMITNRLGDDTNLLQAIKNKDIAIQSKDPEGVSFFVTLLLSWGPMILLMVVFYFIMNRVGKGGGGPQIFNVGKSKARESSENDANVTFKDVAGIDEAKQELQEVVEFLKEPEKFKKIGARIPKGVLLLGSPGTGKTLLAKAVAGEAKVPFFSMSGSEFVEMFVGVGASRVRDLFGKARKNSPCIVFIDEIDAVGRKRGTGQGGGNDEREQTLNQLLVEMDGFGTDETIIVLAATNRPDVLDNALRRPGRFDRQVMVDKPDVKGRKAILEVHAKNKSFDKDIDFEVLAKKTAGLVGADLANILNEAAILAARAGRSSISMADLEEASEKVEMGPEKRSKIVSEIDRKITAYHEAGHAVVNYAMGGEDKVHKITVIPRGFAGGYTMSLPAEEKMYQSKKFLLERMVELYGGRAAEDLIFGDENITTGASNDIERATSIAQYIVTKVGMTKKFGPIMLDGTQDGDMFQRKYYSEETGKEVDDEIRRIVTEAYEKAKQILRDNREKLEAITKVLLEKETIMGDEFEAIMLGKNIENN